jgi:hypothetical protein
MKRCLIYAGSLLLVIAFGNVLWFFMPYLPGYYRYRTYQEPVLEYPQAKMSYDERIGSSIDLVMRSADSRETVIAYYTELLEEQGWKVEYEDVDRIGFVYPAVYFEENRIIQMDIHSISIKLDLERDTTVIRLYKQNNMYRM